MAQESITDAFVASTVYNVSFQMIFRILTFVLNGVLIRFITRELLGVANVRLMLLYTTASFLVREPFRKACLSSGEGGSEKRSWGALVNTLWLCPLMFVPIGLGLGVVWTHLLSHPSSEIDNFYSWSVFFYLLAIFLECLAMPLWILSQQFLLVRSKAVLEAVQVFVRNILVAVLVILWPRLQLAAFSIAMMTSSAAYLIGYWVLFWLLATGRMSTPPDFPFRRLRDLLPQLRFGLDPGAFRLGRSFFLHSLLKQFLTEGERYVMTFTGVVSFADQGVYDVIHNLGSLVARVFFAPLEESAYNIFSLNIDRHKAFSEQNKEKMESATRVLRILVRLAAVVGCIVCVFGYAYSFLALQLYGGATLSSGVGPTLLRWYCGYVVLLAFNGITEAFCFAAMSGQQIHQHASLLVVFCAVFLTSCVFLTERFGAVGFIWSNSFNMILRIAFSFKFICGLYGLGAENPLRSVFPSKQTMLLLLVSLFFTAVSEISFGCQGFFNTVAHIGVGAVLLFATLMSIHSSDAELINFIEEHILKKKIKTI